MILRRHIGKRLADYYAQPANRVVGASTEIVQFHNLWGEWHWKRVYGKLYKEQQGQWLTPVELFRPHYSHILANFIKAEVMSDDSSDFHIVELGGGRGTNATVILDRLLQETPQLYDRLLSYTLVDASPTLHDFQKQALQDGPHKHKIQFSFQDLTKVAEGHATLVTKSNTPTIFLGMELLDNLAHDKIRRIPNGKLEQAQITTTRTTSTDNITDLLHHTETFVPLTDPLLLDLKSTIPTFGSSAPFWFPTVACALFQHIAQVRPNASLAMADFDWLPPPDLNVDTQQRQPRASAWADGEPIVTDMHGIDHECYLQAPHLVDILYPTDFPKLAAFVRTMFAGVTKVRKQSNFLQTYGDMDVNVTKSWLTGYTPLLEDFGNCSVLTVSRQETQQAITNRRKPANKV